MRDFIRYHEDYTQVIEDGRNDTSRPFITKDDILNLNISLNTYEDVNDFVSSLG